LIAMLYDTEYLACAEPVRHAGVSAAAVTLVLAVLMLLLQCM